jgi:response regulator RpfG family c-di-GMP phosphodiesterase
MLIASRMGWEKERIAWIEAGALLHDLGKIGVTDAILQKEGKLNEAEKADRYQLRSKGESNEHQTILEKKLWSV